MAVTVSFQAPHLHHRPPMSAARIRRARLRRAAMWAQVGWAAFIAGSAALALGLTGLAKGFTVAGIVALGVWVVAYGLVIYSTRARAMARGDRTLQEHIARVKRSRYRQSYPSASGAASPDHVEPYRPPAWLLAPGGH